MVIFRFVRVYTFLLAVILYPAGAGFPQPPSGYYNSASGLTGTDLRSALHNIIKDHTVLSYTPGVWNAFYSTDDKPNGTVWDMYSDIPNGTPNGNPPYVYQFGTDQCGISYTEGDCYSREHSFPKSWFNDQSPMNSDLFHIVPADQYVNAMRSNYPYGVVGAATWTSLNGSKIGPCITPGYTGTVFEPIDAYKGDFARNYFYMATRYYTEDSTWAGSPMVEGSQPKPWALAMLLQWHEQDTVSPKEIDRNNAVYALQDNRNPFIDHPEYAEMIWGSGNIIKAEPSNHVTGFISANGTPPYSTLILSWTDATGSVIPDGYLIEGSTSGFAAITAPGDGTPVPNGGLNRNAGAGIQSCTFSSLSPNTLYYFKIFPYTNSGSNINYKTNGTVPSVSDTTDENTGTGTMEDPLSCLQAINNNTGNGLWVYGYIIGTVISSSNVQLTGPFTTTTNLAIADDPQETVTANMLYVQLPSNIIRTNLNLSANPSNYHKCVIVYGDLQAYYIPHPGLKNTSDYKWFAPTSSIQSGDWKSSAAWNTGIPYQHDDVCVYDSIMVSADGKCNELVIPSTGKLHIATEKNLHVNGRVKILATP